MWDPVYQSRIRPTNDSATGDNGALHRAIKNTVRYGANPTTEHRSRAPSARPGVRRAGSMRGRFGFDDS